MCKLSGASSSATAACQNIPWWAWTKRPNLCKHPVVGLVVNFSQNVRNVREAKPEPLKPRRLKLRSAAWSKQNFKKHTHTHTHTRSKQPSLARRSVMLCNNEVLDLVSSGVHAPAYHFAHVHTHTHTHTKPTTCKICTAAIHASERRDHARTIAKPE